MKNFIKLIKQLHEERCSVVLDKIFKEKIPVAFLSIAPIAQAVDIAKSFRAQGLNISTLFVVDNTPPQSTLTLKLFT